MFSIDVRLWLEIALASHGRGSVDLELRSCRTLSGATFVRDVLVLGMLDFASVLEGWTWLDLGFLCGAFDLCSTDVV